MKNDFYVYALYKDVAKTEPFYIGKGRGKRVDMHHMPSTLKARTPRSCAIRSVIAALGHIPRAILRNGLTEVEAFEAERSLIARYGRKDRRTGVLTNTTDGGEGVSGLIHSEEHRAKNSAALKGRVMTLEHRARIGAAQKWRRCSDAQKERLREVQTGRKQSLQTSIKKSDASRGIPKSAEHVAKLKQAAREAWARRKAIAIERKAA